MKKIVLEGIIPVNCYIIEAGGECFIIDPGYYNNKITSYIEEKDLKVKGILLTHGHFDHIGGINLFNVPVYIHELDYHMLKDDNSNRFKANNISKQFSIKDIEVITFNKNTTFKLGGKTISVTHTPGHTAGSVCFFDGKNLFTGDTLFERAIGRWDLQTGNLKELETSVNYIFNTFTAKDVPIHPGHGFSSTLASEKENNEYVKLALKQELYAKLGGNK